MKRIIIYAAGVSRRLEKTTGNHLKGLLSVNGKRIIEYQLDWVVEQSISEIIIVLGLEHGAYLDALGTSYKGVPIIYIYNKDYRDKGNMLSLWVAKDFCNKDTLFTTSDLICNYEDIKKFNLCDFKNKILIDRTSKTLFFDEDPVKVFIDDGRILKIMKDKNKLPRVDGVAIGIYQFSKEAIANVISSIARKIDAGDDNLSLYYALDSVLEQFCVQPVYSDSCGWIDVDTPDDLIEAVELTRNIDI